LLLGAFGAGGTGKSTLIEVIHVWVRWNHREKELIMTATTGSAAVKIGGTTLHTAFSIPIETPDGKRVGKLKKKQMEVWKQAQYMIVDEVWNVVDIKRRYLPPVIIDS
jgi:PIF1-like helicase